MTHEQSVEPVGNQERVRAYEIAAYLTAASFPLDITHGPPPNPVPSRDLTLNALVQHGVHRMDCDRAFLSLIDNRNQFICAEMTKHQSLVGPDPTQPLLLGVAQIALEWGVCPYTMSIFQGKPVDIPETPYIIADPSYFYIEDFRKIPSFATRPYVAGYPSMVSYMEVPLRSLSGHLLGSYCVVDNKSRDFTQPETLATIREVTSAIGSYLNLKRVDAGRTRSERVIDALRQFIGSERQTPSLRVGAAEVSKPATNPFGLAVFNRASQNEPISCATQNLDNDQLQECPTTSQPLAAQGRSTVASVSASSLPGTLIRSSTNEGAPTKPDQRTFPPLARQETILRPHLPDLANQISEFFVKAADLIGYALNLDGLSIFDAAASGTQYRSSHLPVKLVNEESSQPVALEDEPLAKPLSEFQEDNTAEPLVKCRPKQSLIKRLAEVYPQGRIFAIDEYGVLDYEDHPFGKTDKLQNESSDHSEWEELLECIPNARYAIFLPLWHYQRETCFATCLAWVTNPSKTLDPGDVNSLTAFGNSVMAEIFRAEALTNTQSKSDFISSISHELRSPLHGILATVDIMQESVQDTHLLSMVDMIESCSSTLLDTFDHLLNFTKINSRASGEGHFENNGSPNDHTKGDTRRALVDLGAVVEDVLETVSLGHLSATQTKTGMNSEQRTATIDRAKEAQSGSVIVTTHIENNRNWTIPLEKGAWKRILLNLCSNALKYTKTGYVDVMLRLMDTADGGSPYISLSVVDTGIGMSPEFLKYHVFTPFMQENNLTPGTGLGLSLVKSIVESMQGKIMVESNQHEGTRVTINVPLDQESERLVRSSVDDVSNPYNRLQGLSLALFSIVSDTDSTQRIVPTPKELERSIRNICEGMLGMTVTQISADSMPKTDLILIDMHALASPDTFDPETFFGKAASNLARSAVLTLGGPTKELTGFFKTDTFTCISSPITSKRLATALLAALTKAQTTLPNTNIPTQPPSQDLPARPKPAKPPLTRLSSEDTRSSFQCRFTHFLLVDDNPINLKVLSAFATRIAVPYDLAHDGAEAVHLYKQAALEGSKPFDCVFMDISMPVMDGFEAVAAIRRFEDETMGSTRSYILALTGLGSEAAKTSARTSGFDGLMVKPVRFRDMMPLLAVQGSV